ncbi:MAG: anhydro-N-acetylmuramic acid kinase [Microscillaceae bacterium]|nr:anhydro-N-acetylmuramic acid kinase [Microscillaceae bacterium]MDW8461676.1 anhydro-N-acetylmuramic acid kinase [Cytophagales bacterium]
MNTDIAKLYHIAQANRRTILGLMSGTSLDGLDLALCHFEGCGTSTKVQLLHFQTITYSIETKNLIREVFAQTQIDLGKLTLLHNFLGNLFAEMVLETLQTWKVKPAEIDCIASHGQTVFHAPKRLHQQPNFGNATLQIADADQIATKTGIITLSDFRQKHIAVGGEGAPLAIYADYLLFSSPQEDRILLNIGGIANFTYLPKNQNANQIIATDVGVGNTFLDYFCQKYFDIPFDKKGQIAQTGKLIPELLQQLFTLDFFEQPFPKSTGQETFANAWVEQIIQSDFQAISPQDLLCTLTHFTVEGIWQAIQKLNLTESTLYVSGGGAYNTFMMNLLNQKIKTYLFDHLGIPAEAKEAVLFALLANETLAGSTIALGNISKVCMGKISLPN